MVLGLLVLTAIPTVTGVAQGISAKKQENAAMKEKIKFNMTAVLSVDGGPPTECWIVLRDGRMYIDHPDAPRPGHKFNGYYFKYPGEQGYQGLVSTIQDDPPMLNWMYADKDTGAVRYGSRKDTIGHVVGPWGWNEDESLLTMDDDDWRFIAVEEDVPQPAAANPSPGDGDGETTSDQQQQQKSLQQEDNDKEEETETCWAVYLSRDRDGSLKPKAERGQEGGEEGEDGTNDSDPIDVRYTHRWAPIRLQRKPQLGVNSHYVGGKTGK